MSCDNCEQPKIPRIINESSYREGRVYSDAVYAIQTEHGAIKRDVIIKRPCVAMLVWNRDSKKFILVDEFRVGPMRNELGLPAGMIDGDELPMAAAIREVKEETGYVPLYVESLGFAYSSSGFTNELLHYFYVEVDGQAGDQNLDKDEHVTIVELSRDDLIKAFKNNEIGAQGHTCYMKWVFNSRFNDGLGRNRMFR